MVLTLSFIVDIRVSAKMRVIEMHGLDVSTFGAMTYMLPAAQTTCMKWSVPQILRSLLMSPCSKRLLSVLQNTSWCWRATSYSFFIKAPTYFVVSSPVLRTRQRSASSALHQIYSIYQYPASSVSSSSWCTEVWHFPEPSRADCVNKASLVPGLGRCAYFACYTTITYRPKDRDQARASCDGRFQVYERSRRACARADFMPVYLLTEVVSSRRRDSI